MSGQVDHERERVAMELEIRHRALESSINGIVITDLDGKLEYVNPAYLRLIGYRSADEVVGRQAREVCSPLLDLPAVLRALREEGGWFGEYEARTRDGTPIPVQVSASLIRGRDGAPLRLMASVVEITARRRAEEKLREAEARFRTLFELTADYAFELGVAADGTLTMDYVTDNFTALTGRTREEVLTVDTWKGIFHPEDYERSMMAVARLVEEPRALELECRSFVRSGELCWIRISARSERDERVGRVTRIVGAIKDITDQKLAEEASRLSEDKYHEIFHTSPDSISITRLSDGRILEVNKGFCEISGYSAEEVLGKTTMAGSMAFWAREEDRERLLAGLNAHGEVIGMEVLMRRKDGAVRSALLSARVLTIRGERCILLIARDITERKRAEEALQRADRLESLGVLAGGIAHDFNNLLAGIFGNVDLARAAPTQAEAREYLDATLTSMSRARALTQQLLTFAKGGAPVQKMVPLAPLLHEAVRFATSGTTVACRFDLAPDLWPCQIDRNQIGQVIDNIVINADQAMPGGGTLEVTARNERLGEGDHPVLAAGDYVRLSIRDSGIGIPRDVLPHIFDPFYTTKSKGQGLGLAICHSIIRRHSGAIEVESEPGAGSVFHVFLPAASAPVEDEPAVTASHLGSGAILVVDDEEMVRLLLEKMCASFGYSVRSLPDGRGVAALCREEARAGRGFAAVILDLTVRGGPGAVETLAEIRALDRELPVFVTSGYADNEVMTDPARHGFQGSLAKPFTIEELSALLNRLNGR